jgi:hypothetical protein
MKLRVPIVALVALALLMMLLLWQLSRHMASDKLPVSGTQQGPAPFVLITPDDVCPGLGSGRKILAAMKQSYRGKFTPPTQRTSPAPKWTGTSAATDLSLSLVHEGAAITCTPGYTPSCPPHAPCAAAQPATLSTVITLKIQSADGMLDETMQGKLQADASSQVTSWSGELTATKLRGKYPMARESGADRLFFRADFEGDVCKGEVDEKSAVLSYAAGTWTASASSQESLFANAK